MNPTDEMADRQHRLDTIVKKINERKEVQEKVEPTFVVPTFMQRRDKPPLLPMEKMDLFERNKGNPQQPHEDKNMWNYGYPVKNQQVQLPPVPPTSLPVQQQYEPSIQPPFQPPIQPPIQPPMQQAGQPLIPEICYCSQWMPGSICSAREFYTNECYMEPRHNAHPHEPDFNDYDNSNY